MQKILATCLIAAAITLAPGAAQARVDVGIGIGIPGIVVAPAAPVSYEPAPVYVEPPRPVVVAPSYYEDWEARAWREQQWRERRWREREWRERHRKWHRRHDDDDDD
ncbi:hypothetical protein [Cupriavidus necator]